MTARPARWHAPRAVAAAALLLALALGSCAPRTTNDADNDAAWVARVVRSFGEALKRVSLLAPPEVAARELAGAYGSDVSPALLARWMENPARAPGRRVSSPWPERIDITAIERTSAGAYRVEGNVVMMTSAGEAGRLAVTLTVERVNVEPPTRGSRPSETPPTRWLITDVARAGP